MKRLLLSILFLIIATPAVAGIDFTWDGVPNEEKVESLASRKTGLKVVFWNIQKGETNHTTRPGELDRNLRALVQSDLKPDVLIFGEYHIDALSIETERDLNREYVQLFVPYNENTPKFGMNIFVHRFVTIKGLYKSGFLDWVPKKWSAEKRAKYRQFWLDKHPEKAAEFDRQILRLRVSRGGDDVDIYPLHLVQPWELIKQRFGRLGTAAVGASLLFGRKNPLMNQVKGLRDDVSEVEAREIEDPRMLLIGDLNLTPWSKGFRTLRKGMDDVFAGNRMATFPAKGTEFDGKISPMQIDLALTKNLDVLMARVLELRGSDHYPVFITLNDDIPTVRLHRTQFYSCNALLE